MENRGRCREGEQNNNLEKSEMKGRGGSGARLDGEGKLGGSGPLKKEGNPEEAKGGGQNPQGDSLTLGRLERGGSRHLCKKERGQWHRRQVQGGKWEGKDMMDPEKLISMSQKNYY